MPEPTRPERPSFYVPALDGLRTVAFLMVWWCHALWPSHPGPAPVSLWVGFLQSGSYGVTVFFVLSAFLITRLLLLEKERTGGIDLRAYYVRRTLRIWPLYFLVVAVAVADAAYYGNLKPKQVLSLLTFTTNWYHVYGGGIPRFAGLLWSVSVEEQFYLVWPLILSRLSERGLRVLCWSMVPVAFVSRVAFVHHQHTNVGMWFSTLSHVDALAYGTLLALGVGRLPALSPWKGLAAILACMAALAFQAHWYPFVFRDDVIDDATAVAYAIVPMIAAAIVGIALAWKDGPLAHPAVTWVGRLTFGLYCFHGIVLTYVHGPSLVGLVGSLVVTLALGWFSYRFYETPFLRMKRRFERVKTRPAN